LFGLARLSVLVVDWANHSVFVTMFARQLTPVSTKISLSLRSVAIGGARKTAYSSAHLIGNATALRGNGIDNVMKTAVPGPETRKFVVPARQRRAATSFVGDVGEYRTFNGAYVLDAEGNRMLDMFSHIASLPLGHDHPELDEFSEDDALMSLYAQSLFCP